MPNSPYTIDGMPESVSAVMRMTPTMRLPRLAYSTRYTAVKMPKGTASRSAVSVIMSVVAIAGVSDTFSVVYVQAKSEGFRCGMPRTRM